MKEEDTRWRGSGGEEEEEEEIIRIFLNSRETDRQTAHTEDRARIDPSSETIRRSLPLIRGHELIAKEPDSSQTHANTQTLPLYYENNIGMINTNQFDWSKGSLYLLKGGGGWRWLTIMHWTVRCEGGWRVSGCVSWYNFIAQGFAYYNQLHSIIIHIYVCVTTDRGHTDSWPTTATPAWNKCPLASPD